MTSTDQCGVQVFNITSSVPRRAWDATLSLDALALERLPVLEARYSSYLASSATSSGSSFLENRPNRNPPLLPFFFLRLLSTSMLQHNNY